MSGIGRIRGMVLAATASLALGCGMPGRVPGNPQEPSGAQAPATITVAVRLDFAASLRTQAVVDRHTRAEIAFVDVKVLTTEANPAVAPGLWPEEAVLNQAGEPIGVRVDRVDLDAEVVFGNLRPGTRYRFRALAYRTLEGGGDELISTGASFLDHLADPLTEGAIPRIPVILANTVFAGSSADNPIVIEDGVVRTATPDATIQGFLVETVAGSSRGYFDGPGPEAAFDRPLGLAASSDGALLVADSANHRIRKVLPDGSVATVAGSVKGYQDGATSDARFNTPGGVAFLAGAVVVADTGNNCIRRIQPESGDVETLAGARFPGFADGTGPYAGFSRPAAIASLDSSAIVVADTGNHCIRKVDISGVVSTVAGVCGQKGYQDGPVARFDSPGGITVDPRTGDILVADTGNHAIRRISPDATVQTIAGNGEYGDANGIGGAARFDGPLGIAVDVQGQILVADTGNHVIRLIAPDGAVQTVAGSKYEGNADGFAGEAEVAAPAGLAIMGDDWFLADSRNHRIRRLYAR